MIRVNKERTVEPIVSTSFLRTVVTIAGSSCSIRWSPGDWTTVAGWWHARVSLGRAILIRSWLGGVRSRRARVTLVSIALAAVRCLSLWSLGRISSVLSLVTAIRINVAHIRRRRLAIARAHCEVKSEKRRLVEESLIGIALTVSVNYDSEME